MNHSPGVRALAMALLTLIALAACSQGAAPSVDTAEPIATSAIQGATPVGSVEGHFNPTEAVGGGANSSRAVTDVSSVFAAVPQISQLRLSANASPPGATGADVASVSIVAQDVGGLLKGLDGPGKQSLGDAILTSASAAWPNAAISLLVTDASGGGSQIIGSHPRGGPNTVIAT